MFKANLTVEIEKCANGKWRIVLIGESCRSEGEPKFETREDAKRAIYSLAKIGTH